MSGFGDIVQKAVYLGIGLASYASEQAGSKLSELKSQAQKLADELVEKGEMSADEARRFVDDMVRRSQQGSEPTVEPSATSQPRSIEIQSDDEETASSNAQSANVDALRQQMETLKAELERLKRQG